MRVGSQLQLRSCNRPVCESPCLQRCPYDSEREHMKFRRDVRAGKAVGPLTYLDGMWAVTVEGWMPWPDANCWGDDPTDEAEPTKKARKRKVRQPSPERPFKNQHTTLAESLTVHPLDVQ